MVSLTEFFKIPSYNLGPPLRVYQVLTLFPVHCYVCTKIRLSEGIRVLRKASVASVGTNVQTHQPVWHIEPRRMGMTRYR